VGKLKSIEEELVECPGSTWDGQTIFPLDREV